MQELNTAIGDLEALSDKHGVIGKQLFDKCEASLYPADSAALAVLNRSMSLIKGFILLVSNGGYIPAVGLLRMQLDNILRFHGISSSADPHDIANKVANGVPLRNIKGTNGKPMTDAHLKEQLADNNPWITRVYEISSGYIHFSDQHIRHLLQRSAIDEEGYRQVAIGDEDIYIRDDQRIDLVNTFLAVTRGVLTTVGSWINRRESAGTNAELSTRFKNAI